MSWIHHAGTLVSVLGAGAGTPSAGAGNEGLFLSATHLRDLRVDGESAMPGSGEPQSGMSERVCKPVFSGFE